MYHVLKIILPSLLILLALQGTCLAEETQNIQQLKELAEKGDVTAQFNLGLMYFNGNIVPQDYIQAAHYYELAAEQGFAKAQYNIGAMYEAGNGVLQNDTKAVHYYELAAEQGDVGAIQALESVDKVRVTTVSSRKVAVNPPSYYLDIYKENEVNGNNLFKGKVFGVKGIITDIRSDAFGNPQIIMSIDEDDSLEDDSSEKDSSKKAMSGILFRFNKDLVDAISKLRKDTVIEIAGRVSGEIASRNSDEFYEYVVFTNCYFLQ